MKRPSPSFVVQHKRRSRLAKDEPASIWSDDIGRELRGLLRDEAPPTHDDLPSKPVEKKVPRGEAHAMSAPKRILEAQAEPSPESEPPVVAEPARRGRPRKLREPADRPESTPQGADRTVEVAKLPEEMPPIASPDDSIPPASPPAQKERPSFRERRRAARQALPLADRWRWNLRY